MLRIQNDERNPVGNFFKHGGQDQRAVALRIPRNYQEHNLPGQARSEKPVEIFRMRNRWRRLPPNHPLHEIDRSKYEQAVNPRYEKYNLRESHVWLNTLIFSWKAAQGEFN